MKRRFWHALIKPSTLAFWREGRRTPGYTLFDTLHGYVYARWPYLYIGVGTGEHRLTRFIVPLITWLTSPFQGHGGNGRNQKPAEHDSGEAPQTGTFADTYHGKVVPLRAAKKLVSVKEAIQLPDLEKVIPYNKARDIILKNPDHLVALDCPCRVSRPEPCLPLDVCLIVGEPFASFVAEHQPGRARWITAEQAVEILRAEDERGHVHHAFFKDAMLGRFYAICNCCACCCGAMQAQRNGTPMLASSGYVCRGEEDLCLACGECVDYCQFNVLTMGTLNVEVSAQDCMGCGVCASKCAEGALTLVRAPQKGLPLEIYELVS